MGGPGEHDRVHATARISDVASSRARNAIDVNQLRPTILARGAGGGAQNGSTRRKRAGIDARIVAEGWALSCCHGRSVLYRSEASHALKHAERELSVLLRSDRPVG